ncbi:MAG: hypothetical protein AMQ22_00607 [Candidatus Methanofastidiosum methylothiophilum]|uniref:Uncharacterized protein n=1 Tax=Candidatus Methanofastidiosum methylothiophilum TaxID=1705564 RepID=A0A150J6H0_9EURY|nr:MAG: hypothetical protein AMQ22_00607 [Candidatus Methanofastidiosum methylthiophilus]
MTTYIEIGMVVNCPKRQEDISFSECCECEYFVKTDRFYNDIECSYECNEPDA